MQANNTETTATELSAIGSLIKPPVMTDLITAASDLSTKPEVWIKVGLMLYQWINNPKELSNHPTDTTMQDRVRYDLMCALYRSKLGKNRIPIEWELNQNGCPTHSTELSGKAVQFGLQAESIQNSNYGMKQNIIKIIGSIERLFQSIRKRTYTPWTWKTYRCDGYEAMFFTDLTHWLSVDLPIASITSPSTAEMLLKRIDFCKAVQNKVFIFRDDAKINNPKDKLGRIIKNLETLHQDICKTINAASFNNYIDEIDNNLIDMASNTFNVCFLILENVHQRELQVDELLYPHPVDKKMKLLNKTLMGQWIKITLNTIGINSNNFQASKKIDLKAITNHLEVNFKKIILDETGLHNFIKADTYRTKKENAELSRNILAKLINVHRELLNIYFVKSSLVQAARVGIYLGENWLYGNEEGQVIIGALLKVIQNASIKFKNTITDFWTLFYTDTYIPYALRNNKDIRDPVFEFLLLANEQINKIEHCVATVTTTVETLKAKSANFNHSKEKSQKAKVELINNLYLYLSQEVGADENEIKMLGKLATTAENEYNTSSHGSTVVITPVSIEPHIVKIPKSKIPSFILAQRLLAPLAETCALNLGMLAKPNKFHTAIQERIYEEFLVPISDLVNSGIIRSTWYNLTNFSMTELRAYYSRVNTIMKDLYSPDTLARASACIAGSSDLSTEDFSEEDIFYFLNKGAVTVWSTEMQLVDQFLTMAQYRFAKAYYDNPISKPLLENNFQLLHINENEDTIEVSIDKRLLTFAGGAFAIELQEMKNELARKDEKIKELSLLNTNLVAELTQAKALIEEQNLALQEKDGVIADKDLVIADKDLVIADKDLVLARKDKLIENQSLDLSAKDFIIKEQVSVISRKDEVIDTQVLDLSAKDRVLADQKRTIETLELSLSQLDKTRPCLGFFSHADTASSHKQFTQAKI